jgi:SAM-dependent methyltransferase
VLGLPDLDERRIEPELMDAPGLEPARHLHALEALARVNAVSGSAGHVWTEVERLAGRGVSPVRVLDVACGGGDVLCALARRAERHGTAVELDGCDVSAVALERARSLGRPLGVRFRELDVLRENLPGGHDVVCSSLFLHHLARDEAIRLLRGMAAVAQHVVLLQDLRRTRVGYVLARLGLVVLTRSDVARHDGPVSVGAALTLDEARGLAREAGLDGAEVRRCWPQRFLLRWERAA